MTARLAPTISPSRGALQAGERLAEVFREATGPAKVVEHVAPCHVVEHDHPWPLRDPLCHENVKVRRAHLVNDDIKALHRMASVESGMMIDGQNVGDWGRGFESTVHEQFDVRPLGEERYELTTVVGDAAFLGRQGGPHGDARSPPTGLNPRRSPGRLV
jgi:hypothetical protein